MDPVEDWSQDQFVPFSPRHMPVPVQPETDASLLFPYNFASSQQDANLYSDVRLCMSQLSDVELKSVENAIDMELQDLLSCTAIGNTSASCNAAVHDDDECAEDSVSNVDSMSDCELDSDTERHTESSLGTDFSRPTSCNSAVKRSIVQNWLADDHVRNSNNAGLTKNRKLKREVSTQNSVNQSKPCSRMPSECNDNTSKWQDSSKSNAASSDNQSLCSRFPSKQHSAASESSLQSSADTEVECRSIKSILRRPRKKSVEESRKHQKTKSVSKTHAVASRAQNWQVTNISERCCLFEYKQQILNQMPAHRTSRPTVRQAYCHIGERWGLTFVRHVRGDHFAAVRAILYQALVNNFLHENVTGKFQDSCKKLHVFADARNRFLYCWNFANRIPYDRGREVEVLSDCLEEFHGVIESMSCVPSRVLREDYLMCLLNRNPDVDLRLLESVKFLMMERALCVYRQIQWRKQHCCPQAAEFWLFSSLCPERLFRQRINPLGDTVKAGPMEFQLLGYALGIQIEMIQPSMFQCCDFVTRYLCEGISSMDNLCLIIEEDNEYCVLTA